MTITELQLPTAAGQAAQLCLAVSLPASTAAAVRAAATRAAAYADELLQCGQAVLDASRSAGWTGAAADAFSQRLSGGAPNLQATADRFAGYAVALLGYASRLDDLLQQLGYARADLAAQYAVARVSPLPGPVSPLPGIANSLTALTQQSQLARQQDDELLRLAQRFSCLYNQWVQAVRQCVAGIKAADRADPTHDLHGWALWEHAAARYVSPMTDFWSHPSWAKASSALAWLGSNLTFVAIAIMPLCPGVAAAVFMVTAALSAIQLGVDAWRKYKLHDPTVTDGDLIMDGIGAFPAAGMAEGAKDIGIAARLGWADADALGTNRVAGLVSRGASETVDVAKYAVQHPLDFYSPGYRSVTKDYYRSGPARELAKKWASTVLWDAPNAVLGLPGMGGTSLPQALEPAAKASAKDAKAVAKKVDRELREVPTHLDRDVDPPP